MTNVPLDFLVNETFLHHELLPNDFDLMALEGIMPGSHAHCAAMYPGLFRDAKAVENRIASLKRFEGEKPPLNPYKNIYIGNLGGFFTPTGSSVSQRHAQGRPLVDSRFKYRLEGERGPWKVCHFRRRDIPFESALERIEKALGRAVVVHGEPEWLAGCEPPETPISAPAPIDVDPEPQVIVFKDDDHICEFYGLNRPERKKWKKLCRKTSGDDPKSVMTKKLGLLSLVIGKERLCGGGVSAA